MTFEEILPAVKAGGKARRPLWAELGGRIATHLELVTLDGFGRVLACPVAGRSGYLLFTCSQWDLLAEDWELL